MAKKRINLYVEPELYEEFKKVLPVTGDTISGVFDHAMREYISAIKMIIESNDKDSLFDMMKRKMELVEQEADKRLKAAQELMK